MFPAVAAEQQHAPRHRVIVPELLEAVEIGAPDRAGALDLDREQAVAAVGDEVDFRAGRGTPEEEIELEGPVGDGGAQLLEDQRLQGGAVDLLGAVERTGGTDRPEDADVEQEELR